MDEFKKYLQEHKSEMDIDTPSPNLLQRIQTQTMPGKKGNLYPLLLRITAAACILALITVGLKWMLDKKQTKIETAGTPPVPKTPDTVPNSNDSSTPKDTATTNEANNIAVVNPQKKLSGKKQSVPYQLMQSFEYNYTQLVKLQLKNIKSTPVYGETQDYFNGFKQTLKQIDTDEATIKYNIKTNGLDDILLEQLINVYQQKITVLKNLQQEMNKINNKVKDNQLPTDTLKTHYITI